MKRMTAIVITIELINWYIDWPMGWQILFSVFGVLLWLMVWCVETSEPDPEQLKPPPRFYESTFFHDN